jgi:hypothetical protein
MADQFAYTIILLIPVIYLEQMNILLESGTEEHLELVVENQIVHVAGQSVNREEEFLFGQVPDLDCFVEQRNSHFLYVVHFHDLHDLVFNRVNFVTGLVLLQVPAVD